MWRRSAREPVTSSDLSDVAGDGLHGKLGDGVRKAA